MTDSEFLRDLSPRIIPQVRTECRRFGFWKYVRSNSYGTISRVSIWLALARDECLIEVRTVELSSNVLVGSQTEPQTYVMAGACSIFSQRQWYGRSSL